MDGKIIDSKTTILVVHKKPVISSPKTINCLFFGASLMSDGVICGEALRRINGNTSSGKPDPLNIANLTLKSFGHNANYVNNYKVNHEAYGGWTWKNFLTNNNVSRVNGIIVTLSSPHGYEINTVQKSIWTDNNGLKWELEELPSSTTIKFNRHENTKPQNEITLPTSMTSESLSLSITISKSEWEPGNPFWNPDTNEVDFNYHANKYGAEGGYQIAYCITTYNQAGVPFPGTEDWNKDISDYAKRNIEENIKPLLRILHKQMPNCKMIIPSIALPSDMGGIATSYTTNTFYGCSLKMKAYAFEYSRCLEELCLEDEFKDWVIFNDDKAQFDVDYSYPTGTRKANARATTEEDIQTNAIHPTKEGKELIADSLFRGIIKILNSDI